MRNPHIFLHPAIGFVVLAVVLAALTAGLAPFVGEDALLPVALTYLLFVLAAAAIWGWIVGITGAVAADLLVNFFFVPPLHRFRVQEPENVVALVVYLAVASVGASMLSLLRRQLNVAQMAKAEAEILSQVSREVAGGVSPRDSLDRLCGAIARALQAGGCAVVTPGRPWRVVGTSAGLASLSREEELLAEQAIEHRDTVFRRRGPQRRLRALAAAHEADITFVPILSGPGAPAVLRLRGFIRPPAGVPVARLLSSFANEASVALHRAHLQEEAQEVAALRRADEFKTALLSSVSHDLRSPLTAIKAAVGSLRDESLVLTGEDRRAFLATIESQTDRLTNTVTDLLDMSRLEGGAVTPTFESIEASELIDEVAAATSQATVGREVRRQGGDGVWLRADYGLMIQALSNLIENAAKYSTPGGPIVLAARQDKRTVALSVSDVGPGIPARDLPHIFDKFYRGAGEAKARGTGLGLSIVKAVVELCGGSVHVSSSPGGTTFTLKLAAGQAPV